jgi:hypothetical protein
MQQWSKQHLAFIVEMFFLNGDSVVRIWRIFRNHFNIARQGKVPCRNTIQLWVGTFRTSASALKKKQPGSVRTVRSPQNIEAVRQSFIRSPRRSDRRHSVALAISNRSVRRNLHKDLNFHPCGMVVVQELSDCTMANHSTRTVAECLIGILLDDVIILMTDSAHFQLPGCVNK